MTNMHDLKKEQDRALLIGIDKGEKDRDIESSMEELAELAKTAGIETAGILTQKRDIPHPATYLGKGKLDELQDLIKYQEHEPNMLIFNDELSPAQFRNLSDKFDIRIIDRTLLILDIFAAGAASAEGKMQVELAQYKYRMSRLSGMGKMLSRLGGGIGTRGPGETKLETDRRHIRSRLYSLEQGLKEIRQNRETMRKRREKQGVFQAALVGYTNAGKSSIINLLTQDSNYVADKLFATLDTTVRRMTLPCGNEVLISDTVGFIERLPHHLVQAFRATLEELQYADVLIFVADAASPYRENHMDVVLKTLDDLKLSKKPLIHVNNKMDKDVTLPLLQASGAQFAVQMSAKTGKGKEDLLAAIETVMNQGKSRMSLMIPHENGKMISYVYNHCDILEESREEQGAFFEVYADDEGSKRLAEYKITTLTL